MTDINEITQRLRAVLSQKRYCHSLAVASLAREMARAFGANEDKAYLAGLLHDCAKLPERMAELTDKYADMLDSETLLCPPVVHAPLGAILAREEYGITDGEVLCAIARHTVAGEGMSLLDKIIYIADMAEAGRDFDGVDLIRKYCLTDIDKAYKTTLSQSLIFNIKAGNRLHPDTLRAWNEFLLTEEKL